MLVRIDALFSGVRSADKIAQSGANPDGSQPQAPPPGMMG
jgi:hypothetical protein